jgi:hypothetical protein
MPLTAHAITARKAEQVSPTHRVSVETLHKHRFPI